MDSKNKNEKKSSDMCHAKGIFRVMILCQMKVVNYTDSWVFYKMLKVFSNVSEDITYDWTPKVPGGDA